MPQPRLIGEPQAIPNGGSASARPHLLHHSALCRLSA